MKNTRKPHQISSFQMRQIWDRWQALDDNSLQKKLLSVIFPTIADFRDACEEINKKSWAEYRWYQRMLLRAEDKSENGPGEDISSECLVDMLKAYTIPGDSEWKTRPG